MKFKTLRYISHAPAGNPILGYGEVLTVSSRGTAFNIHVFVEGGALRAAYCQLSKNQLTHFNDTSFTFDATGDIIDLLDTSTWETLLYNVILSDAPTIFLEFENVTLKLHVYPCGGVEVLSVSENKTSSFG